jgi:hypothetical protein
MTVHKLLATQACSAIRQAKTEPVGDVLDDLESRIALEPRQNTGIRIGRFPGIGMIDPDFYLGLSKESPCKEENCRDAPEWL